jgi:hypothetical protein
MKQKKLFLLMFSSVLLSSTFISCEEDGMYGIEEDLYPCSEEMESVKTRAAYTEYLSLPTYDPLKWSQEEHDKMVLAAERMGISFVNNCYVFTATSGKEVNISDSLFITVKKQFGYTNKILNEASFNTVNRLKRGNPESSIKNDCVPRAIEHMGKNAPSFAAAVAMCDQCDPGWRERGGVQGGYVGLIINKFAKVFSMYGGKNLPDTINITPNRCVMLLKRIGAYEHAVNVTQISRVNNKYCFAYEDHSSNGLTNGGSAYGDAITVIYPFIPSSSNSSDNTIIIVKSNN